MFEGLYLEKNLRPSNISAECTKQIRFIGCYHIFPSCDLSTSVVKPRKICKETCLKFHSECRVYIEAMKQFYLSGDPRADHKYWSKDPEIMDAIECSEKPSVTAGDAVECIAYAWEENLDDIGTLP